MKLVSWVKKLSIRELVFVLFGVMVVLGGISGWVFAGLSTAGGELTAWRLLLFWLVLLAGGAGLAYLLAASVTAATEAAKTTAAAQTVTISQATDAAAVEDCKRFVYVGADSFREGRICGDVMGQELHGRGKVIVVTREHGHSINVRESGFSSILEEKYPNMQIAAVIEDKDREFDNVEALLKEAFKQTPDIDGIYVVDGNTPETVIKFLVETGRARKIKLVCHDMVDATMRGVAEGIVTCTISQDPYAQGYNPVVYLYNYLVAGKLPPRPRMTTKLIRVTPENYTQYWDAERGVIESGTGKDRLAQLVDQLPDRPLRIIFLGRDVPFYFPVREAVLHLAEVLKSRNVTVEWIDPSIHMTHGGFQTAVDEYAAKKYDGIILPLYSPLYIPSVNRAVDAGIPVAIFNSEPDNIHTLTNTLLYQSRDLFNITLALAQSATESGERAVQINEAISAMRQALTLESESAMQAIESTRQIATAIGGIDRGAEQQTQAAGNVSEATQDISKAVEGTRQASITNEKTSIEAARIARQGASTIEETLQQIEEMSSAVNASSDKIHELNKISRQIDSIVNTVNDMAEQSNLLALNASIEAARAGMEGSGFGVVASEIRDLAERSKKATKEIGALVRAVQRNSLQMVETADEATRQAKAGSQLANEAGKALNTLLESAESMREQSEQVVRANASVIQSLNRLGEANQRVSAVIVENASATRQVTRNIQETVERVNHMTNISQENVAAIEGIHDLSDEVANQSDRLKTNVASLVQMAEELQGAVVAFQLNQKRH